jgi:hypothetical protein
MPLEPPCPLAPEPDAEPLRPDEDDELLEFRSPVDEDDEFRSALVDDDELRSALDAPMPPLDDDDPDSPLDVPLVSERRLLLPVPPVVLLALPDESTGQLLISAGLITSPCTMISVS